MGRAMHPRITLQCVGCDASMVVRQNESHQKGTLRGLLCRRCNIGLGQFRDDVEVMKRAITYLESGEGWNDVQALRQHLRS